MSRAHVSGFDSNAEQFARAGNPWHGEPVLRKKARKGLRKLGPAKAERPGLPRVVERSSRLASEAFENLQCRAALAAALKADSGKSRTVAPATSPRLSPTLAIFTAPSRAELSGWSRLERQVARVRQRAEVEARLEAGRLAHAASEATKQAERRRLETMLASIESRLNAL